MTEREAAQAHLLAADPRLAQLAAEQGLVDPYEWPGIPVRGGDLLGGLVLHIVAQQISTAAALAIFGRLRTLLGGEIVAEPMAAASEEELRSVGLSGAKARALQEIGQRVSAGTLDLAALRGLDDDDAQEQLTALRGVGPWSAQMFLLHELQRPDVFPAADVALRGAIARLDRLPAVPGPREAADRAAAWAPYRSYAAAHLWSSNRRASESRARRASSTA
ncbi:MAG: DNA-3-methyladenine glycosylase 2 family protein [Solirubrobacteraceae bacterium]